MEHRKEHTKEAARRTLLRSAKHFARQSLLPTLFSWLEALALWLLSLVDRAGFARKKYFERTLEVFAATPVDDTAGFLSGACRAFLDGGAPASRLCALLPEDVEAFPRKKDHHYVPSYYGANQHKQPDLVSLPVFGELAGQVIRKRLTLLHYDRLHTLHSLIADLFGPGSRIEGAVAEVGVYKGGSLFFMASLLAALGRDDVPLHGFDSFSGHDAQDIEPSLEPIHTPGLFGDTLFENVVAALAPWPAVRLHKGRFQDTCQGLDRDRFAFVHLDADLYAVTRDALRFFGPRLAVGGVIVLDDYGFNTTPGVVKAAQEFLAATPGWRLVPLLSGQGVLVRCAA
ncbi:MAG: TylF/MycF/NovP-related O-methyltransferase [Thermodesulfobacteriota bacterium]